MDKKNTITFLLVISLATTIVVAGIIFSKKQPEIYIENIEETIEFAIKPVTDADHIIGNPKADVILVEYSDFKCPYCKDFQNTIERLVQEYGKTGDFAWVYRHFPSADAFSEKQTISKTSSIASECVGYLVSETEFWRFASDIYGILPDNFTETDLRNLAIEHGVDEFDYDKCMLSGQFDAKIQLNIDDGLKIYEFDPNFGTPYSIIITKTGEQIEINGAQPYEVLEQIIKKHLFPDSL